MSHGRADDTCKGEQVRNTDQHSQHSPFHPGSSQCGHFKSLNIFSARWQYLPWLQAGVCRLTSVRSDYSSDSSDQCPPLCCSPLGPAATTAETAIVTNTASTTLNTLWTLVYYYFCNVQIFFWVYKNIFAVVSNSGLSSAGAGAGVWRAERRVRTSVTTFSVTNGQGIPNEASPRRHNYTLHQPEIRHVSIVRQNTRRRSRLTFIPQSNWVVCLQQCMP